jgi:glutamate-5-semialdehyde dehydrogenase
MTAADLDATIAHMGAAARAASARMGAAPTLAKNTALRALARRLREDAEALQQANAADLAAAGANGLAAPLLDRLKLTPTILETSAAGCEEIAAMPTRSAKSASCGSARAASASAACACRSASSP